MWGDEGYNSTLSAHSSFGVLLLPTEVVEVGLASSLA